jgi:uncharacterized damage-inducible protein DinB
MAEIERVDPPRDAPEKQTLTMFLDWYRATLELKCDGVDDAALRSRAVPPSNLSLLGLVRHLAEVERHWFTHGVAGQPREDIWCTPENEDADFDDVDAADIAQAFRMWRTECDVSRVLTAERELDATFRNRNDVAISLRWVLVHMIEEYARHLGHADLLRERIDGVTGD